MVDEAKQGQEHCEREMGISGENRAIPLSNPKQERANHHSQPKEQCPEYNGGLESLFERGYLVLEIVRDAGKDQNVKQIDRLKDKEREDPQNC